LSGGGTDGVDPTEDDGAGDDPGDVDDPGGVAGGLAIDAGPSGAREAPNGPDSLALPDRGVDAQPTIASIRTTATTAVPLDRDPGVRCGISIANYPTTIRAETHPQTRANHGSARSEGAWTAEGPVADFP
jgi:hypothetical protein